MKTTLLASVAAVLMPASAVASAASRSGGEPAPSVTAAQPGAALVQSGPGASSRGIGGRTAHRFLSSGQGAGEAFCGQNSGYALGANFDNVYACGPATGAADAFDTVGFQCVELSERFLWVVDHQTIPNVPDGKGFVQAGAADLSLPIGSPAQGALPAVGDPVSMWGDSGTQPYGHTAIVTAVNVNASGDGTIAIMEENGITSGWDQITVSHWSEAYGNPNWGGGYYYYNHIQWLEVKPNTPPHPPLTANLQFAVHGLGSNAVATGINDSGTMTGFIQHPRTHGPTVDQPFLLDSGSGKWTYPGSPSSSAQTVGINDSGAVAAWAQKSSSGTLGYALHVQQHVQWSALPVPAGTKAANDRATSIDGWGDISGWLSDSASRTPTSGVVWTHVKGAYQARVLHANKWFHSPVVTATDHWGDAVGTEMIGTSKSFAAVWAPWGTAYRLPALAPENTYSVATAMLSPSGGSQRTLTIVGASRNAAGVLQACEWTVLAGPDSLHISAPVALALGPSSAVAINSSGWVVGNLAASGTSNRVFLWRPDNGITDLQTLVGASTGWVVQSVSGINSSGQVVAQGYNAKTPALDQTRGLVLQPRSAGSGS